MRRTVEELNRAIGEIRASAEMPTQLSRRTRELFAQLSDSLNADAEQEKLERVIAPFMAASRAASARVYARQQRTSE